MPENLSDNRHGCCRVRRTLCWSLFTTNTLSTINPSCIVTHLCCVVAGQNPIFAPPVDEPRPLGFSPPSPPRARARRAGRRQANRSARERGPESTDQTSATDTHGECVPAVGGPFCRPSRRRRERSVAIGLSNAFTRYGYEL